MTNNHQYYILTPNELQQFFWVLLMLASSAAHHLIQVKLKCSITLQIFHLLRQRLDEFHRSLKNDLMKCSLLTQKEELGYVPFKKNTKIHSPTQFFPLVSDS